MRPMNTPAFNPPSMKTGLTALLHEIDLCQAADTEVLLALIEPTLGKSSRPWLRPIKFSSEELKDIQRSTTKLVMRRVPEPGQRCPYDPSLMVKGVSIHWEASDGIKGTVAFADGTEEVENEFWVPKDAERGLRADVGCDELD